MKRFIGLAGAVALVLGMVWIFLKPAPPIATGNPSSATTAPAKWTSTGVPLAAPQEPALKPAAITRSTAAATVETPPADVPANAPNKPAPTPEDISTTLTAIETQADASTPESLNALVVYAVTDNKAVRSSALNALIRRADPAAVSLLRSAAKASDDPHVIVDLLQTADYLALPSVTMSELPHSETKPAPATNAPRQLK